MRGRRIKQKRLATEVEQTHIDTNLRPKAEIISRFSLIIVINRGVSSVLKY